MHVRTIFFALVATLVLSTGLWLWRNIGVNGSRIRQHREELERLEEQFQTLLEVTESYDAVKDRYQSFLEEFDSLRGEIPDRDSYITVLENVRKLAEKQNVEILTLSPIREDSYPAIKQKLKYTGKHIERYPVQLQLFGDFLTIGAFLEELISLPMIVNIGRISLETELEAGGGLSCELLLYTYMFFDKAGNKA